VSRFHTLFIALCGIVLLHTSFQVFAVPTSAQLQMLNGLSASQKAQLAGIAAGGRSTPSVAMPNITSPIVRPNEGNNEAANELKEAIDKSLKSGVISSSLLR